MKKAILFILAVVCLSFAYASYSDALYFNPSWLSALVLLALLSIAAFFVDPSSEFGTAWFAACAALTLLVLFAYYYYVFGAWVPLQLASAAIATLLVYLASRYALRRRRLGPYARFAAVVALSAAIALAAYVVLFSSNLLVSTSDEVAYNYYAAALFLAGKNPYTSSMMPIMARLSMVPTASLNGSYEYAYGYPPLSFIDFLPVSLIVPPSQAVWFPSILLGLFICTCASFFVYCRSGFNKYSLMLMFAWLSMVGQTAYHVPQYAAISLLLTIAYAERRRPYLSGALLGIAACTVQLAWPALPFFYVLALREHGRRHAIVQVASSAAASLLAASYFIAMSPHSTISNILLLVGQGGFLPSGINIGQLSMVLFPLPLWYFTALAGVVYVLMLLLFYSDTRSFSPLIAVAPFLLYFLSTRNQPYYAMPFIPLLIGVYYCGRPTAGRRLRFYKIVPGIAGAAILLLAAVAVLLHGAYASYPLITISGASINATSNYSEISGTVYNNYAANQTVSFIVLTSNPPREEYYAGPNAVTVPSHTGYRFAVEIGIPPNELSGSTRAIVIAMSSDYTAYVQIAR